MVFCFVELAVDCCIWVLLFWFDIVGLFCL